nr:hypothetical protein [uncultured Desulfobulbus sp.]
MASQPKYFTRCWFSIWLEKYCTFFTALVGKNENKISFCFDLKKQVQVIMDHAERLEELATTPAGLDLLV